MIQRRIERGRFPAASPERKHRRIGHRLACELGKFGIPIADDDHLELVRRVIELGKRLQLLDQLRPLVVGGHDHSYRRLGRYLLPGPRAGQQQRERVADQYPTRAGGTHPE